MSDVLVINAGYEPMKRVSPRKAINMLIRGVAVIEEYIEGEFYGSFPMPVTIRLVRYVKIRWRDPKPKWSRKRMFARDNYRCQFLGCDAPGVEVEHVHPKSRGGQNTWENTVASCRRHNSHKGNKTLKESGMKLKRQPYAPDWNEIYHFGG